MARLRLMTIIGTRPEIIRLSEVIKKCDRYFDHLLVHTGQNWDYTLNEIFFQELAIRKPDYFLEAAGRNLGETIGNVITRSYNLLQEQAPDALLVLGDTNSALCAIAAKRLKIPIFHMEAGNRCFDPNVPEEINRTLVDHLSDINLPYTEHGRRYLLSEGIRKEHIYVTGSPLPEVFARHRAEIDASTALARLNLEKRKYILVSAHREENLEIERNFFHLVDTLNQIAEYYGMPLVYSTHPRSYMRISERKIKFNPLISNLKPFGFFDYNKLQQNAFCVISDSGTLSEESALLRFPAALIRTSTERPEVLEKGSLVIGGLIADEVIPAIDMATALFDREPAPPLPADYNDTNVSTKVVQIIQSYTRIIDRVVWDKP